MAIEFNQAELDALNSDTQRLGVFFRLATDPLVSLWAGVGDCRPGINALDATGITYKGFGQLRDVPTVQQLINGLAERVTFTLSGVSADIVAMASAESEIVKGKPVALGISLFGPDWQQLGPVYWLFRGIADYVVLNQASDAGGGVPQITRNVQLSVGSLFTGRRRRGASYLTDYDQKSRSPTDKFCERVNLYTNQVSLVWPIF